MLVTFRSFTGKQDAEIALVPGANLSGANLSGANLSGADLSGANLSGAFGLSQFAVANPLGDIVGWKKLANGAIAQLLVPIDAKRVNAYGSRKCRAEYAYCVAVHGAASGASGHDRKMIYAPGTRIVPDKYDSDPRIECSSGIHFFITREEAEAY